MVTSAWYTEPASRSRPFYQHNWKVGGWELWEVVLSDGWVQQVPGLAGVLEDQGRMEDLLAREVGRGLH